MRLSFLHTISRLNFYFVTNTTTVRIILLQYSDSKVIFMTISPDYCEYEGVEPMIRISASVI